MDVKPLTSLKDRLLENIANGPLTIPRDVNNAGLGSKQSLDLSTLLPSQQKSTVDSFEKSPQTDEVKNDDKSLTREAGGLKISYQFDLFYQLSQKVSAQMGQKGADRFAEVASKVTETFKGSLSLTIDPIGSYMNGTGKSLNISPDTANKFMDSVDKLADLSPESLQNFLKESDKFFGDLENTYGKANGAFQDIKTKMQEQAQNFFNGVKDIQQQALDQSSAALAGSIPGTDQTLPSGGQLPAGNNAQSAVVPQIGQTDGQIPLLFGKGATASQGDYQNFMKGFADYVNKLRAQMMQDFLGGSLASKDRYGKSDGSEKKDDSAAKITDASSGGSLKLGTAAQSEKSTSAGETAATDATSDTGNAGSSSEIARLEVSETVVTRSRSRLLELFNNTSNKNLADEAQKLDTKG
ncbi:MAG: hypothetical protein HQM09_02635 [Candidatus Riflebacteria bacterium]|nr:hypothetical protein [Candidatus Riflebacteria bacterium]